MKPHRLIVLTALTLAVAGCSNVATVSRNAALNVPELSAMPSQQRSYAVQDVRAIVSPALRVSEANSYYPITDIVWRGDPIGDRHTQIASLFETAAGRGAETLRGEVPVVVDVELVRFHGVTERTRFSVGGVYNIMFNLTVRDAVSGTVIEPTRLVEADLPAPGGQAAVRLDQSGQTEKVRITDFLTMVLQRELTGPVAVTLGGV